MLVPDRHRALLDEVRRRGSAQIGHLAEAVGVSESTVRRDLSVLESEGLLQRVRGGAFVRASVTPNSRTVARRAQPQQGDGKARLGRRAAELLEDGMTVMILAGTTTAAVLPELAGRSLSVVTNGLDIALALAPHPEITVVVLGGMLHREQMTLLGPLTEQAMADLHVDVMVAGAFGIDADVGVTGAKLTQAGYHHSMLRHTERLVVLATGEKFGRQGPTLLARAEQVDTFVTDPDAPPAVLDALRARGSTVIVA